LKTVVYIPNEDENDTRPPVKEIPNLSNDISSLDKFSNNSRTYESENGDSHNTECEQLLLPTTNESTQNTNKNNNDQLPSPTTSDDSSSTSKNKGKGKEVANDYDINEQEQEQDLPIENYVPITDVAPSSTMVNRPMSPASIHNDDEASSSKVSLNEESISTSINEDQNNLLPLPNKNKEVSNEVLSPTVSSAKKETKVSNSKIIYNEKKCSICFDDFQVNEKVIMLECSHM